MEFIKERWVVPLLNFVEGPGVPLLNFEGGPGIPLKNFTEVSGPTFKLSGRSLISGPRVLRSRVSRSWSHFYTMPCFYSFSLFLLFCSPSAWILNLILVSILIPEVFFHLNYKISLGFLLIKEKSLGLLELAFKM